MKKEKQKLCHNHYMEDEKTKKDMLKLVPRNGLSEFIRVCTSDGVDKLKKK